MKKLKDNKDLVNDTEPQEDNSDGATPETNLTVKQVIGMRLMTNQPLVTKDELKSFGKKALVAVLAIGGAVGLGLIAKNKLGAGLDLPAMMPDGIEPDIPFDPDPIEVSEVETEIVNL